MALIAAERVKLFSTRSAWSCAALALAVMIGFGMLIVGNHVEGTFVPTVASTQFGYPFALAVIVVLAALSVTTEFRVGTLYTSYLAVPARTPILLAKALVVAAFAFCVGELAAFGAWGAGYVVAPDGLALDSTADWFMVAGTGPVFAFAAVVGVASGLLLQHSAGVALLIVYVLIAEDAVAAIPDVGIDIHRWLPFNVAKKFLSGDGGASGGRNGGNAQVLSDSPLSQPVALAYFAGIALLFLALAVRSAKKRDSSGG
ncbi:hypothetical protein AB5J62_10265 [Amycolatopsis sp. cg5]|uniref:hypothetical protein n=1 Tax=Amycolatopsis sp. cg5 TaxID=3238802 RepID=UPI00352357E5